VNPIEELALAAPEGLLASLAGPFRRAIRVHPRRGTPQGWGALAVVPFSPRGFFHGDDIDPGDRLDYHTGTTYPQDAASQLPVLLLDPRPGEIVVDACAAPGSKASQIGIALGDDGLLICCDASEPRRRILIENLARQGVACALVTPMPLAALAERQPACADAVLVDAPCSGHEIRSQRQIQRMASIQQSILSQAAELVRGGGRMVYSTCTPYREENESVIGEFLTAHPGWAVERCVSPGCDEDLLGIGACRLWPQRQGTEPFFACRLRAPAADRTTDLAGNLPVFDDLAQRWLPQSQLHCWRRGELSFIASAAAAQCALPSQARGLILGRGGEKNFQLDPWAAQALIERGAEAIAIEHDLACRLWADGERLSVDCSGLVQTIAGAPLGLVDHGRLLLPSRMRRSGLR
jgi:16S rRNA C967 or C1407 C5-methylase (RsmB/RsmF family)